jgi:hypothetical protein
MWPAGLVARHRILTQRNKRSAYGTKPELGSGQRFGPGLFAFESEHQWGGNFAFRKGLTAAGSALK